MNTAILVTSSFTIHWALQSIKRGNRAGLQAGLVLTLALGSTFLITQMLEYSRVGPSPMDGAFGTIFYGLTGLHGAHVFGADASSRSPRSGLSAAISASRDHHGVEIPGIHHWHFVDVMWIVVYTTIYLL